MTACVNRKHTKKVAAVVTASLVGALSLGVAPVAAVADTGIDMLATDQDNWAKGDFEFNVSPSANGSYSVKEGETLSFMSATDVTGNEYGAADVTVLFAESDGTLVDDAATIAYRPGTMPKNTGTYTVYVFKGDIVDPSTDKLYDYQNSTAVSALTGINDVYASFTVKVTADTEALADVQAFEYNASADDDGASDTEFNYTGGTLNIAFKSGDEVLTPGTDYNVAWISGPETPVLNAGGYYTATAAGTYTARLKGDGTNYSGSVDVTFQVKGIDFSSASVSIAPVKENTITAPSITDLTVNGVKLDSAAQVKLTLVAENDGPVVTTSGNLPVGKYTYRVEKTTGDNVKGSTTVDLYVVKNTVTYTYAGGSLPTTFNPAFGMSFTPDAFAATDGTSKVPFTVTVTKDGQEVTSYDEPGTYKVVLDTPRGENANGSYAGHLETSFLVGGAVSYSGSTIYVSIDGKNVADTDQLEYTGAELAPVVAIRNSDNEKLAEGTDYTWKLIDADENEIESANAVGSYKIIVTYADGTEDDLKFSIKKATIDSAKTSADFFAIPADGSAATPTFIGSTDSDFDKGIKFDLDADLISVAYYNALTDSDGDLVLDSDGNPQISTTRVDAKDLTKAGTYFAKINVLSTAENIEGSGITVPFVLAESVAFTDVDANAWYADPVYKAAELKYMNGISGTRLFMPEANITRAEIACVMFNMAGGVADPDKNYPTGFEDVAADTWYSQAVAWASQNGVINGYDTGLYGTFDNATREQVAAILYNYADAQGMDVSVDDADATLAKFGDGAQVSDWAKEAVAWAVENGVMGNGGFLNPTGTITRAEVAAMAVNFQPEAL